MNVFKATADFDDWLAKRLPVIRQDIALKHQSMAEDAFPFFRATFYRWLQHWPEVCGDLAKAPTVLAVGDLHVENFGTWRDEEGRLIWGVNDLDEVWPGAYTLDLVRLTTSAYLAAAAEHLSLTRREAAEAIEEGYRAMPWRRVAKRLSWRNTTNGYGFWPPVSFATPCVSGRKCSSARPTPRSRRRKSVSSSRLPFPSREPLIS